jgi:(1->4)-alpha-D-glucan 1-alpha-D-glucosylmutase
MGEMRVGCYRVQLRPDWGFSSATEIAEYLRRLGLSHLYASPHLQAAAGSSHGYDVVDPGRVNVELGGEEGRRALCGELRRLGLLQLMDIVPNHMAIRGGQNAWWWDVLENGPSSRYSSFFDVQWSTGSIDKVLLPILGDQYGVELEGGKIELARQGSRFVVRYFEHENPVAPRSLGPVLREAAERAGSGDLGFLADAFEELPLPGAGDETRKRRHRDKEVLMRVLGRLLEEEPAAASHVDGVLAHINSDPDRLDEVLERQNYRLAYWKLGNQELDYRRFFDIDSLVGLRVEEDEVFEATHGLALQWLRDGSVHGLRIDHIDGLYDPEVYLRRLREAAPHAWLLTEKILEGSERLPPSWPIDGTTGYDFLNHAMRVLTDPDGEEPLTRAWAELAPEEVDFEDLVVECKRLVLREALASDLNRLVGRLAALGHERRRHRDWSRYELGEALAEIVVAFPVYRTYLRPTGEGVGETDRQVIEGACRRARSRRDDIDPRVFDFVQSVLLLESAAADELKFVMRFQQLTGPAMAKGLEDTAFYRYARFLALNEVGGDPARFGETREELHSWLAERQRLSPQSLNATSTHDTKRSEDVRARLLVLSEVPKEWWRHVRRWRRRLAPAVHALSGGRPAPEPQMEYAVWQNLVGAWPISEERLAEYARKAARETKRRTSWHRPDEAYEKALADYVSALFADAELVGEVEAFVSKIADAGYRNSLAQVLLKVLAPGVPDVYQGTELWDFSLVDPDNRRPVDFDLRRGLLSSLDGRSAEELWESRPDGAVKLHVLSRLLDLRARQPDALGPEGDYRALETTGRDERRVIAFARGDTVVGILTRWWQRRGGLGAARLSLPEGRWTNVLTGSGPWAGDVKVAEVIGPLPVAALERVSDEGRSERRAR